MSVNKYANLPDIDTAQDVYETEDIVASSQTRGDSSDDEAIAPTRSTLRKNIETSKEELDSSHLIGAQQASRLFKRAEKKKERTHYRYPPSSSSSGSDDDDSKPHRVSLSHRLRHLQAELQSLEAELADPSNPLLLKEKEEDNVDPGQLILGLVDVRRRLEKVRHDKEGRGRLVGVVLGNQQPKPTESQPPPPQEDSEPTKPTTEKEAVRSLAEMDQRVGNLEKLIGSSTTSLDESNPLPPPLLPQISRLSAQLGVLTQPRHIDSISRRLKLLLSELERTQMSQAHHKRHPSQSQPQLGPSSMQDQLLPLLSKLSPSLPQIPHILMRLRTLSALHTSASEFEETMKDLEKGQMKMRESIGELEEAVERLESGLEENRRVIQGNVGGLEERVKGLLERMG